MPLLARLLVVAAFLGLLLVSSRAYAQTVAANEDLVVLHDGAEMRGKLVEVLPGDHATLQLATGQTATIAWTVIARIERMREPHAAPASILTPTTGSVTVHIDSPVSVDLMREVADDSPESAVATTTDERERPRAKRRKTHWVPVCGSPCDAPVSLEGNYRIGGENGIRTTHAFHLNGRAGDRVIVSVDPSTTRGFVGGILVGSLGVAGMGAGIAYLFVAFTRGVLGSNTEAETTTGLVFLGAGAGVGLTGLAMMLGSLHSGSTQSVDTPALRVPERARASMPGVAAAPAITLWSGSF